ncbi:DUF3182 family protein [Xanthobacter sp. KR7-65]|uniref:DUF3182 family protein n=1 Tax=Xanthobacter sp. KR7-65 TaxID=3156612 RepID=UPI0032B32E09
MSLAVPTPAATPVPVLQPALSSVSTRRAVLHHRDPAMPERGHRARSVAALAARLALLRGDGPVVTTAQPTAPDREGPYVVPDSTLLTEDAHRLGIVGADDLYGGVVPSRFVAGKSITHPRLDADAACPAGWSDGFAADVMPHALGGFSAFTVKDAQAAAHRLLIRGPVRLKPAWADGGHEQVVASDERGVARALAELDSGCLAECGLVLEEDLSDVLTFSVGRVDVGALRIAYVGTQRMTTNNTGGPAYGGSRLYVVRGGFAELAAAPLPDALHRAAGHARAYDEAADRHYPGFFASRRNYDVVLGRDARGRSRAGVLEQSWRIGGASGAEIVALKALNDPGLRSVVAACHEAYGPAANPPPEADIYYHADDPEVGYLTKYAFIESRTHA